VQLLDLFREQKVTIPASSFGENAAFSQIQRHAALSVFYFYIDYPVPYSLFPVPSGTNFSATPFMQ
jgi:hypothetical protein